MPDFEPTNSQKQAINDRGRSVLVSAGAGSGKTKVLVERLMGYLTDLSDPRDIDSFLIITYTKAAAGELKGRILAELTRRLSLLTEDDPIYAHLKRQSALCSRAHISTIHGFCKSLIQENIQQLELPPAITVIDDIRAKQMRSDALEQVLNEFYDKAEEGSPFLRLVDTVSPGRDDKKLSQVILSLYDKMQSHADPAAWAARQRQLLTGSFADLSESDWGREYLRLLQEDVRFWAGEFDRMLVRLQEEPFIYERYCENFTATRNGLLALADAMDEGWDAARTRLEVPFDRLPPTRPKGLGKGEANPYDEFTQPFKDHREKCKGILNKKWAPAFREDSASLLSQLHTMSAPMLALLDAEAAFASRYAADKRREGMLDYGDLEHFAAGLLLAPDGSPTELARSVSLRFTEIMVDEYQDVSDVQDRLFHAISREGKNLFMVGDVKQSIYRFRLANPANFLRKYNAYPLISEAAPDENCLILLQENFRSRHEILDCANSIFRSCMSEDFGDVAYDEKAELICGADYYTTPGVLPELILVPNVSEVVLDENETDSESETGTDEDLSAREKEAHVIARRILSLVTDPSQTLQGKGEPRPIRFEDICILLRSIKSVGSIYRDVLASYGIPVVSGVGDGFFQTAEIRSVIALLNVLENPHRDIPLLTVLRSPLVGFSPDDLAAVRACDRYSDLWTALCLRAGQDEKSAAFVRRMEDIRSFLPELNMVELLWYLYASLDVLTVWSAAPGGNFRQANLRKLTEKASDFRSTGSRGLHMFLRWLERMEEDNAAAAPAVDASNAVSIMTVHKSKGLEFPIVFLADISHGFNREDSRSPVLVHPRLGLGCNVVEAERRVSYPTFARNAILAVNNREEMSEALRVLYVALTRPKERLYITAAVKDPDLVFQKAMERMESFPLRREADGRPVYDPLPAQLFTAESSWLPWILNAAAREGWEHLLYKEDLYTDGSAAALSLPAPPQELCGQWLEQLERNLAFVYPHEEAVSLPSKVTATELKHAEDELEQQLEPDRDPTPRLSTAEPAYLFPLPDFLREQKPLSPAERGTATHLVLQYMEPRLGLEEESVRQEIQRLLLAGMLTQREAEGIEPGTIVSLFRSELGQRILNAKKAVREFKFSLLCDAGEFLGRAAGDEVLLQGVVDCWLEEPDGIVIIDYKTDHVRTPEQLAQRAEGYHAQVLAYARALRRITGKPVKECFLYFLSMGQAVSVELQK